MSYSHILAIQNAAFLLRALASPGNLLEMQNLGPNPDLLHHKLHCNKAPKCGGLALKLEEHCSESQRSSGWSSMEGC